MRFGLSEEQQLLTDNLGNFLAAEVPLERVRKIIASGADEDLNLQLSALGIPGIFISEDFGGSGLGIFDAALVSELLGNFVTPGAFITTAVMAPTILAVTNQSQLMADIAAGKLQIGVGFADKPIGLEQDGIINSKLPIVMGYGADKYLLCDSLGNIYLLNSSEVHQTPLPTIDQTRTIGELSCSNACATHLTQDPALVTKALLAGRVMLAADTLGAAQYMLDEAVGYAKHRHQFGQPIGAFQAVKHMCAEMVAALEPCRAFVWYAAHALDISADDADWIVAHAKAHIDEVGQFIARTATEVHGGMGFTDLLGLHLWFKRIGFNRQNLGAPQQLREEAAHIQQF